MKKSKKEQVGIVYCMVTLAYVENKPQAQRISEYLNSLGFETNVVRNEIRMIEVGFNKAKKLARKFAKKNSIKILGWEDLEDYITVEIPLDL